MYIMFISLNSFLRISYMKYLKCLGFFSFETKATAKKRKKENLIEAQKTGPEMVINVNAGTA